MRKFFVSSLVIFAFVALIGCGTEGSETTVVDSGTYEGTIQEVNAEEDEIYVDLGEQGVIELYFTDETSLTQNGESVAFDQLQKGQSVEVRVNRVGQRLDPIRVRILD